MFIVQTYNKLSLLNIFHLINLNLISGRAGFQKHVRKHHQSDQTFPCARCGKDFPTCFVLYKHRKTCSLNQKRSVPCDKCDMKFASIGRLRVHKTKNHYQGEKNASRPIHESVRYVSLTIFLVCSINKLLVVKCNLDLMTLNKVTTCHFL